MSFSPGRTIGIIVGAVAILAVGVYGPAMLLGPLPNATVEQSAADASAADPIALTLPGDGATSVLLLGDEPATIATAGDPEPLPIGAAVKLVTALVTVDALPLPAAQRGAQLTIGAADVADFQRYTAEDARTLPVTAGEVWSQRDALRAVLIGSSNNHADTLVRWAFGSVDAYVDRANGWLEANGFQTLRVDDATGLSGDSVGTADEVARLGALVLADEALASMYDPEVTVIGERDLSNTVDHLGDDGAQTLARGYTDQAGLVFVYRTEAVVEGAEAPLELVVAMVRYPDYETLDPAVASLAESVAAAAQPREVITAGDEYATVRTAWGDTAALVATTGRTVNEWGAVPGEPEIEVEPFVTAAADATIGRVTVPVAGAEVSSPLALTAELGDPGPIWRLTNPAAIIGAFFAGQK